jgi:cytochrome b561
MATRPDSAARYTAVAQAFHWLLALALVAIVVMGLVMAHGPLPPATKFKLFQLHKSVGITILALAVLRLLWRLTHRPPALPSDMPPVERAGAHLAHLLLYGLMIGLPLVGWALVSISPFNLPTVLYGLVPWPHIEALSRLPRAEKTMWEPVVAALHAYGAYLLIGLVAVHALAALRHHFVLHDDVLRRMLPGRRRPIEDAAE